MANAGLKITRRSNKRQRQSTTSSVESDVSNTPIEKKTETIPSTLINELKSDTNSSLQTLESRKLTLENELSKYQIGKPLMRIDEPGVSSSGDRLKRCHRDYLLQEMEWMAVDFMQERKWRLKTARTLASSLDSYHTKKKTMVFRQEKLEKEAKKRLAAKISRDIKRFWTKIDKIVTYKVKLQSEEVHKAAMAHHLNTLVSQTEVYAANLAQTFQSDTGMLPMIQGDGNVATIQRGDITLDENIEAGKIESYVDDTDKYDVDMESREKTESAMESLYNVKHEPMSESDSDYMENTLNDEDDERTLDIEESAPGGIQTKEQAAKELEELANDQELSIEELRAKYLHLNEYEVSSIKSKQSNGSSESITSPAESDEEYNVSGSEADDETTIEEEEAYAEATNSNEMNELQELQDDNNLTIDELRAKYNLPPIESSNNATDQEYEDELQDSLISQENSKMLLVDDTEYTSYPFLLTSKLQLRAYQRTGVQWLLSLWKHRLNGILADEMGLGKTIQTITLLAHLASTYGHWGPHLIVVPTSCLLNWEMEFKRWAPAFKTLTYYGSLKNRKQLRQGWSKPNAFHVCITSYQLVVQDAACFKRKKWYYLILDEAHHIKNYQSLRWQTLCQFSSQRRLLLTGTPLQNNLLELWALMHFLMPQIFQSRQEFAYWFQNPLSLMVESKDTSSTPLIGQLHSIIRPFVLRRLKKDVAKQLPEKFEHLVTCTLSKRQQFLYEDFMSRSSTRQALGYTTGRAPNVMSMMNILMQLRKVCNHPDLFEPRPILAPLDLQPLEQNIPAICVLEELKWNKRPWFHTSTFIELETNEVEKYESKQFAKLFVYDVNMEMEQRDEGEHKYITENKHIRKRWEEQRQLEQVYWQMKRQWNERRFKLQIQTKITIPIYGFDCRRSVTIPLHELSPAMAVHAARRNARSREYLTDAICQIVESPVDRMIKAIDTVEMSICYVPKARTKPLSVWFTGQGSQRLRHTSNAYAQATKPLLSLCQSAPVYNAWKRTQLYFPDKRLLQFDCGKLQQLANLLRELKKRSHRCLIFTQMSSMLNILESFLNIHGHTYFRLDGATKVDTRQQLMERFNKDPSIFCFILSTRSGGLGINLTGADTVIFYDSDWNPAMDAQAQDRAHRIGQTRDVHIYRLVTEKTVEENILKKAQEKKALDFLVMSKGEFTTEYFSFSKANLRELVGAEEIDSGDDEMEEEEDEKIIQAAMVHVEDAIDVKMLHEVTEEKKRLDELEDEESEEEIEHNRKRKRRDKVDIENENRESQLDDGDQEDGEQEEGGSEEIDENESENDEEELETADEEMDTADEDIEEIIEVPLPKQKKRRITTAQASATPSREEIQLKSLKSLKTISSLTTALNPVDRYALLFREEIDPLYAFVPTLQSLETELAKDTTLEDAKKKDLADLVEENRLIEEGELLTGILDDTNVSYAQFYKKQRANVHYEQRQRKLKGEDYEQLICPVTHRPYYFNHVTREATWDLPLSWKRNQELELARIEKWNGLPHSVLLCLMSFTAIYPDRLYSLALVSKYWREAAMSQSLYFHVTRAMVSFSEPIPSLNLSELVANMKKGETLYFQSGVYVVTKKVSISVPIQLLGAPGTHVEIQFQTPNACIEWTARGGQLKGIHFTRKKPDDIIQSNHFVPKTETVGSTWQHLVHVTNGGQLHISYCNFDGGYLGNSCVAVTSLPDHVFAEDEARRGKGLPIDASSTLIMHECQITGGGASGIFMFHGHMVLRRNSIFHNAHTGILILAGHAVIKRNRIYDHPRFGVRLLYHTGMVVMEENCIYHNICGNFDVENSGRRFTIRWNEMLKKQNQNLQLPHQHGHWKIYGPKLETIKEEIRKVETLDNMPPSNGPKVSGKKRTRQVVAKEMGVYEFQDTCELPGKKKVKKPRKKKEEGGVESQSTNTTPGSVEGPNPLTATSDVLMAGVNKSDIPNAPNPGASIPDAPMPETQKSVVPIPQEPQSDGPKPNATIPDTSTLEACNLDTAAQNAPITDVSIPEDHKSNISVSETPTPAVNPQDPPHIQNQIKKIDRHD